MKKKYITPSTVVLEINYNEMLCASYVYIHYGENGNGITAESPIYNGIDWSFDDED